MKSGKPDMRHYPFRGIYAEIAREEGISRQAVKEAALKGDARIIEKIETKIAERRSMIEVYNDSFPRD